MLGENILWQLKSCGKLKFKESNSEEAFSRHDSLRRGIKIWIFRNYRNSLWNYLRNPSKLSNPFCALNLFGSYSWMRSFARAGFAYGWSISFSLGSRCVLFKKSTSCVVDMIRRFDVPTLWKMKGWKWIFVCSCRLLLIADLPEQNNAKYLLVQFKYWLTSHRKVSPLPFSQWDFCKDWKSPQIEVSAMEWHRFSRSVVLKPPALSPPDDGRLYVMQTVSLCCKIENY